MTSSLKKSTKVQQRNVASMERARACPNDCNLDHPIAVFARRQGVSRSTVYRWKEMGLPVQQTLIGPRINCQQGRQFLRHKPQS